MNRDVAARANAEESPPPLAEEIVERLAALSESLAGGTPDPSTTELPQDPQQRARVRHAQRVLFLLEQQRQRSSSQRAKTIHAISDSFSYDPQTGSGRLGRFQLLRELGRGGGGIVFLARDPHLQRELALKVPTLERLVDKTAREGFLREAQAAAGLDHPNIVSVYDTGEAGGVGWIASAYCEGPTLSQWLRQQDEPVPARTAAELVAVLADAVEYTHQRGILHRDLKPGNVLLTGIGDRGSGIGDFTSNDPSPTPDARPPIPVPRITDFGLAKLMEETGNTTRTGTINGTTAYMAPEQASGRTRDISPATDIYALGVILYELLVGRPPFQGATDLDTLRQVVDAEPLPLRQSRADVPRDLEIICLKCLQKAPHARYESAQALADDLRRFLRGEPIVARPVARFERLAKWARRRPASAALIGVSVLALLTLTAGVLFYSIEVSQHNVDLSDALERERKLFAEADRLGKEADQQRKEAERREREVRRQAYISNIWRTNDLFNRNVPQMIRESLQFYLPKPGHPDLRGFEWYYLWHLGRHQRCYRGHQTPVTAVAWSPVGKFCASGSASGTVKVWDAYHERCVETFTDFHREIWCLDWSTDGKLLAYSAELDESNTAPLVVREIGTQKKYVYEQLGWEVRDVVFVPNRNQLMMYVYKWGEPRKLVLWDWRTNSKTLYHSKNCYQITRPFFDGESRYIGFSWLERAKGPPASVVWDFASKRVVKKLSGGRIEDLIVLPGERITAALWHDRGREVRVVDVNSGETLLSVTPEGAVGGIFLTQNGRCLISQDIHTESSVEFWDIHSGQLKGTWSTTGHMLAEDLSHDGDLLALGSSYNCLFIIHPDTVNEFDLLPGPGQGGEAWSLAFSPDGKTLAAGYDDEAGLNLESLMLWDVGSGKRLDNLLGHKGTVMDLAYSPDGKLFATASYDKTVKLWKMKDLNSPITLRGHSDPVRRLAFHPSGELLATAGDDYTIKLWEVPAGKMKKSWAAHTLKIHALAFTRDGRTLASASGDDFVKLWDARTGKLKRKIPMATGVGSLQFHPKQPWFVAGRNDGIIEYREIETGKLVQTLTGHPEVVQILTFSPDAKTLASGGDKGNVLLWHAETGELMMPLKTTGALIHDLTFSPQGDILAGASHDGNVILWRAPKPPQ